MVGTRGVEIGHKVIFEKGTNVSPEQTKALLKDAGDLIERYPPKHGPLFLNVVTDQEMQSHGKDQYVMGFAFTQSSSITLRASAITDEPLKDPTHFNIPSASVVSTRQYFLTHEWGHITDENTNKIRKLVFKQIGGAPSTYGKTNEIESYAESFAEWALTKGKTNYLSVKQYAEYYGWGK